MFPIRREEGFLPVMVTMSIHMAEPTPTTFEPETVTMPNIVAVGPAVAEVVVLAHVPVPALVVAGQVAVKKIRTPPTGR